MDQPATPAPAPIAAGPAAAEADATPPQLVHLRAIADALATSGHALALLGLGSVGRETARLDAWSDLDFFAIVEPGHKARYIEHLDWLQAAAPLTWHYRNTADGHKALLADGTFCEFAVFEPAELEHIPYAPGRVVWRRDDFEAPIASPQRALPRPNTDETWIVGEALSCLLVGLTRWQRGEKLSAMRFVQSFALDRLIELDALRTHPAPGDPFMPERRVEARHARLATELSTLAPGYEHTPQAALALLEALARRGVAVPAIVEARIRALAGMPPA